MSYRHSSYWDFGGTEEPLPWSSGGILSWSLDTWDVHTTTYRRELGTRVWEEKMSATLEQARLLISPNKWEPHPATPCWVRRAGGDDEGQAQPSARSCGTAASTHMPSGFGIQEKQGSKGIKTQHPGDCVAFPLERSSASAPTLSSVTHFCSKAEKSGPCSGQRLNLQSSPCWAGILRRTRK